MIVCILNASEHSHEQVVFLAQLKNPIYEQENIKSKNA